MVDRDVVIDRLDAAAVTTRYAQAVDRRDWPTVGSFFGEGSTVVGTRFTAPRESYLEQLESAVERYGRTMHFIGNQVVDVDGDQAEVESYAVAYHFAHADGEADLTVGVRYQDELARQDGRWVITRRVVVADWSNSGGTLTLPPR